MKILQVLALALIGVLTLAAFNPEIVVKIADDAQREFIEEPRERAEFEALVDKAENGDRDAMYLVGVQIASDKFYKTDVMKEVLARFTVADGERMIREAAAGGHPDSRYWVWSTDGGSEAEFMEIHKAGSIGARVYVLKHFMTDVCDTSWDAHVSIIQEHNHDPDSYIFAAANFDDAKVQEIADAFDRNVAQIKEYRSESCPS